MQATHFTPSGTTARAHSTFRAFGVAQRCRPRGCCCAEQRTGVSDGKEDIYIGKGKFVRADPARYPSREPLAGGWAGGEKGLAKFIEQLESEGYTKDVKPRVETSRGTQVIRASKYKGADLNYIGKGTFIWVRS